MHGSINYPFVGPSRVIGGGKKDEKLIIRTAVGNTEYQLEVPSAIDDMDVEIPILPLNGSSGNSGSTASNGGLRPNGLGNPSSADRELVGSLPHIDDKYPSETGVLDKAFGTGPTGGYRQSPSYVMGIAKINEHYRRREYEYAMVELNNLLAFYPNSPKLHKMKGTVLVRTGNLELAERAWERAQQLEPDDAGLNQGLRQLQQRIVNSKKTYANSPTASAPVAATTPLMPAAATAVQPATPAPEFKSSTAPVAAAPQSRTARLTTPGQTQGQQQVQRQQQTPRVGQNPSQKNNPPRRAPNQFRQ